MPPASLPGNPPWIYQCDGAMTYCTSPMATALGQAKVPFVTINEEQYPYAHKAAGLGDYV
jgi:hypothetical protein